MERLFTLEDQQRFALLSGDYNPVHIDPVYARKTLFGKAVVHGIHLLLWGLECFLNEVPASVRFLKVRADFWKSVGIGSQVACSWNTDAKGKTTIKIIADGALMMQCSVVAVPRKKNDSKPAISFSPVFVQKPQEFISESLTGKEGSVLLAVDAQLLSAMFPLIAQQVPLEQTALLLGSTRLVGMECPGLHSLFSKLQISFETLPKNEFHWKAVSFNETFKQLTIAIDAPGMSGELTVFHRGAPVRQLSAADALHYVTKNEFSGERVLIIGGSRGIGEVAVKLLAAGGADVVFTYSKGKEEAEKIVTEITSQNGSVKTAAYNVLDEQSEEFLNGVLTEKPPTLLCYFATPFIFAAQPNRFSSELFHKFCEFYVSGFHRTALPLITAGTRKILYPSTVAVDEFPENMGEYAAAKIAGETLCRFLEKGEPGLTIYTPRFPRIETDQTRTLALVDNASPVEITLDALRKTLAKPKLK